MPNNWLDRQQHKGAKIDNHSVVHFGDAAAELQAAKDGTVLADLSYLGLVRVAGEDAKDFLQSQFSNDIQQVNESLSQLSSYCTPKGRMLALMRVLHAPNGYLLLLPHELLPNFMKRLQMFIMRAKVRLSHDDTMLAFGLSGANAAELLQKMGLQVPTEQNASSAHNGITLTRVDGRIDVKIDGGQDRFLLVGPYDDMARLWDQLSVDSTAVGAPVWRWLDIQAGLPNVFSQTVEAFVPQMANLEILNGVNFKKGCYPGQEIVARMQYLGKLKQRMVRLHNNDDITAQPGDRIYAKSFGNNAAGTVVDAQTAPGGGIDLLAVTQIKSAEAGDLCLETTGGPPLNVESLPYSLT